MEPSHESVRRAVEETGDPELLALTASPESYVLRPSAVQGHEFEVFQVLIVDVDHPMGFVLVSDRASGEAKVTSGQPRSVEAVISGDEILADPSTVWELIRDPPLDGELLEAGRTASGGYEFRVRERDGGAVRRLALTLGGDAATWKPAD